MKTKIFTLLLALVVSVGILYAEKVPIGDLYYNLDATNNVKACNKAGYSYWFGSDPELSNGKHPHRPENWYVLVDDTIGTTDSQQYLHSFTLLFDDLIAHHSEGSVYITGSRA